MEIKENHRFGVTSGKEEVYKKTSKAIELKAMFHYTNFDTLIAILRYRTLKLNRVDFFNDLNESRYFDSEYYKLVFASSFGYDKKESIPMWNTYSSEIYGVRIGFFSKNGSILNTILDESKSCKAINGQNEYEVDFFRGKIPNNNLNKNIGIVFEHKNIIYDESLAKRYPIKCAEDLFDLSSMAVYKSSSWKYEKETRIIGCIHQKSFRRRTVFPDIDYLLMPLKFCDLDKIEIIFSPYMSDIIKDIIKNECKFMNLPCKVIFRESKFNNQIKRK